MSGHHSQKRGVMDQSRSAAVATLHRTYIYKDRPQQRVAVQHPYPASAHRPAPPPTCSHLQRLLSSYHSPSQFTTPLHCTGAPKRKDHTATSHSTTPRRPPRREVAAEMSCTTCSVGNEWTGDEVGGERSAGRRWPRGGGGRKTRPARVGASCVPPASVPSPAHCAAFSPTADIHRLCDVGNPRKSSWIYIGRPNGARRAPIPLCMSLTFTTPIIIFLDTDRSRDCGLLQHRRKSRAPRNEKRKAKRGVLSERRSIQSIDALHDEQSLLASFLLGIPCVAHAVQAPRLRLPVHACLPLYEGYFSEHPVRLPSSLSSPRLLTSH